MQDSEKIFESQYLLNTMCSIYSIIARVHNRKATGYALLLGVMARIGGLREEIYKLNSQFVNIRTAQKYDRILAKDFKVELLNQLKKEQEYYLKLKDVTSKLKIAQVDGNAHEIGSSKEVIDHLKNNAPKSLSTVWDNVNLRSGHRHERVGDAWSDSNFDYMTSVHMSDRISVCHIDNASIDRKRPDQMTIWKKTIKWRPEDREKLDFCYFK